MSDGRSPELQAAQLRRLGLSLVAIASELGVSYASADDLSRRGWRLDLAARRDARERSYPAVARAGQDAVTA